MSKQSTKSKPKPPKPAAPLTEAEHRILKAVDLTRWLAGPRDRDKGFALLLVHLSAAYKALYRYSNRADGGGKPDPIFAAIATYEKALHAINGKKWSRREVPKRLVDTLNRAEGALLKTWPTTHDGLRALGRCVVTNWNSIQGPGAALLLPVFKSMARSTIICGRAS